ncbi:hypothetical protein [Alicyclobacillus acidoterrestris]|uniref:Uncharacterized protein n=1 Tax=Alicyclobacillus acidoterrestris (strain ATCC 49025 / DSM 3922 / CIP 106132 / NCIMB 13137 / GD3B) TaxID=1356854 RepID=T0DDC8_ALIAG|nr:hypothetical protein [Alicyclobacillus acidoterrestris]EPZ47656.1 hypothetical protein N007_05205 [Alicyclobacillus acidoterrestris ATCC 49025]UNO48026.1 hypothetical protein K1I37_15235 [Alicyclobacillus acidoterrestris]
MNAEDMNKFFLELFVLCRKYNIQHLQGIITYDNGMYRRYISSIKEFTPRLGDTKDAEKLVRKMLIDYALDTNNKEMFDELTIRDDIE